MHKNYIRYVRLDSVHNTSIKNIKYITSNHTIISSSEDPLNSVTISDPSKNKNSYNFSHSKVNLYSFLI